MHANRIENRLRFFLSAAGLGLLACGQQTPAPSPAREAASQQRELRAPATLADYWADRASFKLARTYTLTNTGWPYGFGAGAHITPSGGAWYLFSRQLVDLRGGGRPAYCTADYLGTEVRRSTDGGVT